MPNSTPPPKPLDQLSELLCKTTNDELLELIARALEAGTDRLENYSACADEPAPPLDVVNEGIVFGHRLKELTPPLVHQQENARDRGQPENRDGMAGSRSRASFRRGGGYVMAARRNAATDVADAFEALADRLERLLNAYKPGPRGGGSTIDDARSAARPQLRLVVDNERKAA